MNWLEFAVTTNGEMAEAVAQLFNAYGHGGAVVEIPVDCLEHELPAADPPATVIVKAYLPLPADGTAPEARRRIEEGLWHLGQIAPIPDAVVRELPEEEWADAWKQHYHVLRVGQRTVIVPAWEEYDAAPDEVVIRLEPGMAFGTGLHPSTQLCLSALERYLVPGCSALDVGTGSGVLAIAAAKLGALAVLGLDNDSVAIAVAEENVIRNGVQGQVTLRHGSLPSSAPDLSQALPGLTARTRRTGRWAVTPSPLDGGLYLLEAGHFDLVVINILAPVIVDMAPALAARLASGGQLIAAGLIACPGDQAGPSVDGHRTSLPGAQPCGQGSGTPLASEGQEGEVVGALEAEGLRIVQRSQDQDWVCLVAQKG